MMLFPEKSQRGIGRSSRASSALAFIALLALVVCGCADSPPDAGDAGETPTAGEPVAPAAAPAAAGPREKLDAYILKAGEYLTANQSEDGSWRYFQSESPDFADPEPHANLFGTMITLMNLTHTGLETSEVFERGARFLLDKKVEGHNVWALYAPEEFGGDSVFEPDIDDTAVALTVLEGKITLTPEDLAKLTALFDAHRTENGLYLTYFDGFYPKKGFVPDPQTPSLGVNLNVLGFLGKYQLETARLLKSIRSLMRQERYWENTGFYRSLPVLAYLASNAIEHGTPEAHEPMRQLLADFEAGAGVAKEFARDLETLELAAYVKSKSHHCLLERLPCRELDWAVFELALRLKTHNYWEPAPFYDYRVNPRALQAFMDREDFMIHRERGGFAYDVERALASPGTVHYYDGSTAETTSFGLKALVFYRELLDQRSTF